MTDPKTWWFLENFAGQWLEDESHGLFTRTPSLALKWPNKTAADDFRSRLRHPLWALRVTEHRWIPSGADWSEHEDAISDAISDSIDMDWSARDGAKAVVRLLNEMGVKLP